MPRFEHLIKLDTLKNALKMKESSDPAAAGLIDPGTELRLKKIANSLRINRPAISANVERAKRTLKNDYIKQWADSRSQGHGVTDVAREKLGNVWLNEYRLLKPSRLIGAMRLRANTFGTKVAPARADENINVMYKRCHAQPETLGHIFGLCQSTKGRRIKRHDEVKNFLTQKLHNKNDVFVEPTIKIEDNLFKPDLVVNNEEWILVVDVTVRYENRDYLEKAEKEKVDKYASCLEELKKRYGVNEGVVLSVVLGNRGAIMPQTII